MADKYFVKCEDCGRRLPGPARKCDVCGGKMSRVAEESYYTPEGPVKKSSYKNAARNTPDRDSRPIKRTTPGSGSRSYSKPSGSRASKNDAPLIDRIGDAVDIIAGDDEFTVDSLKQMGQALAGRKPASKSSSNSKSILGSIAGAITFIVVIGFIIWGSVDDQSYDDDFDDFDSDYNTTYVDKSVSSDGYTLSFDDVEYEEGSELSAYTTILVSGSKDLELTVDSLALEFDDETDATFKYMYITDDEFDISQSLYSDKDSMSLDSGKTYEIEICYSIPSTWNEINLIHNFGGKLSDRDTSLDITASNDNYY